MDHFQVGVKIKHVIPNHQLDVIYIVVSLRCKKKERNSREENATTVWPPLTLGSYILEVQEKVNTSHLSSNLPLFVRYIYKYHAIFYPRDLASSHSNQKKYGLGFYLV